jgi:hypothetical protein
MNLSSSSDADLLGRQDKAEQAKDSQALGRREIVQTGERGPYYRYEKVYRHTLDLQLTQRDGKIDDVLVRLPHSDDSAGTGRQPCLMNVSDRRFAIGERVGTANLRMKILRRVEIMIHGVRASLFEPLRLLGIQKSEAGTDAEVVLTLHLPDCFEDATEDTLAGRPSGNHEAKRPGLESSGTSRCIENSLAGQQWIFLYLSL